MTEPDAPELPQLYLITDEAADSVNFAPRLAACLDRVPVACVMLRMASADADRVARAADACRAITDPRDVALVAQDHLLLAERLGLDGVHLSDGSRSVAAARKALGEDAIVGAYCGTSRHDGMSAGERGADYVTFGPVGETGLGDGTLADHDSFAWWSQMIELPVVAEGGLTPDLIRSLTPVTDFFALGPELWRTDDAAQTLADLAAAMQG